MTGEEKGLMEAYRRMAEDEGREAEALEWAEATVSGRLDRPQVQGFRDTPSLQ